MAHAAWRTRLGARGSPCAPLARTQRTKLRPTLVRSRGVTLSTSAASCLHSGIANAPDAHPGAPPRPRPPPLPPAEPWAGRQPPCIAIMVASPFCARSSSIARCCISDCNARSRSSICGTAGTPGGVDVSAPVWRERHRDARGTLLMAASESHTFLVSAAGGPPSLAPRLCGTSGGSPRAGGATKRALRGEASGARRASGCSGPTSRL